MIGEIIAIGDELTSGRILNTTSHFAARHLFAAGHEIIAMDTIGDEVDLIGETLIRALTRADFVIVTGGLGATSDDMTNEAVAEALARPSVLYPEILTRIRANQRGSAEQVLVSLEKLAWLPTGAHALKSDAHMAGHFLVHDGKPVFFLPGVPHEMKELLIETVISRLSVWEGEEVPTLRQKLYKVNGLPETEINHLLRKVDGSDERVKIGYYPVFPEVHVSLSVSDKGEKAVQTLFNDYHRRIVEILGGYCYGYDQETLESVVGRFLQDRRQTLAVAESCTGGLIGERITEVAGSSEYFTGGVIAYSNDIKSVLLGVDRAILEAHGAVSAETARAMAAGARRMCGADFGLAVTGIAGPSGGTTKKPVGTVYIALADSKGEKDFLCQFKGSRLEIRQAAAQEALDLLRRRLINPEPAAGKKISSCGKK